MCTLNQYHKSQLRGEKKKRQKKNYLWKTLFESEVKTERKRICAILFTLNFVSEFTILDYHSEPSITIKPMRIKRESPCLGLRFMPIKLSKISLIMTSWQHWIFYSSRCQCVRFFFDNAWKHLIVHSSFAIFYPSSDRREKSSFIQINYVKEESFSNCCILPANFRQF